MLFIRTVTLKKVIAFSFLNPDIPGTYMKRVMNYSSPGHKKPEILIFFTITSIIV